MVFVGDVQISDITQFGTIIAILFPLTRYVSRQVKYFIDVYGRYVAAIALLGQRVQKCAAPKLAALPDGHITIKDLTFTHCNLEDGLFKNISLQIKKGETVGFVGRSGSGKTTLVNLLMGHYSELYTGSIHIGEQDIKGLSVAQLRICIAHVPQQVTLFQRSVYDNIAYGSPGITRQQVITAAKQGCADVFVRKLPDGYDTVLNTKGVELSGGQKQRILLSRAMAQMNTANILIIDEGTSALDTETEKEVERAISSVLHETDKTCIVIAHRLSTLRQADRIVVFDNGRIVEMGAHDELLSNPDSAYKKLWNAQLV
jgi:ATP-binding cassette subfamily B protein